MVGIPQDQRIVVTFEHLRRAVFGGCCHPLGMSPAALDESLLQWEPMTVH
jgi:hypothetical protein